MNNQAICASKNTIYIKNKKAKSRTLYALAPPTHRILAPPPPWAKQQPRSPTPRPQATRAPQVAMALIPPRSRLRPTQAHAHAKPHSQNLGLTRRASWP